MAKGITELVNDFKTLHPMAYQKIYNKAIYDFCAMIAGWNSISPENKKVPHEVIREISKQLKGGE